MFVPKLHKYTLQRELYVYVGNYKATMVSLIRALSSPRLEYWEQVPSMLTLLVPSANSVSPLKIAAANRLIHAIHKNCIVYLFL